MEILKYHVLALIIGYVLDLIIGDPHSMPHPIRLIGNWIGFVERKTYKDKKVAGLLLVVLVLLPAFIISSMVCFFAYKISSVIGVIVQSILVFYLLATKSLADESAAVIKALNNSGIEEARKALSMIVGRDTNTLNETQIIKAVIETIAENTSDGVVAPLIYIAIGGPVLGFLYKASNTMDSMVGYNNERYKNYGYYAAKLDDALNYIPSRICAILIIVVACILPMFDGKNSFKIWKRDKRNHKSPNSAQSEAAYAGALDVELAGGAYYFGEWVEKPVIGDRLKEVEKEDVKRSHILLYGTSILCEVICTAVIFIITK